METRETYVSIETTKLLKQANEYAEQHKMRTDFGCWWQETYDTAQQAEAYIAGAHSRDEEIAELKETIRQFKNNKMA